VGNSTIKTTLVAALLSSLVLLPAGGQSADADFQQAVTEYQQSPSVTTAEKVIKMAGICIGPIYDKDYVTAVSILKQAHDMSSNNPNIANTLSFVEGLQMGSADANKLK